MNRASISTALLIAACGSAPPPPDAAPTSDATASSGLDADTSSPMTDPSPGSGDATTDTGDATTTSSDTTVASETSSSGTTGESTSSTLSDSTTASNETSDTAESSSGEVDDGGCFDVEWSVEIDEIDEVFAVAAEAEGRTFAAGSPNGSSAWVGAWDIDGAPLWSRVVDATDLGLTEAAPVAGDMPSREDLDLLAGGDVLLSYGERTDPQAAVFARLDATTGDIVWSVQIGADELSAVAPLVTIDGTRSIRAAVTESGRVFLLGIGYAELERVSFTAELDEDDGAILSISALDPVDAVADVQFAAHDEAGLYRAAAIEEGGATFNGVQRFSLDGELVDELPTPSAIAHISSLALDGDGNLGLSWIRVFDDGNWSPILERRDPAFTLLADVYSDIDISPMIYGRLGFEPDGDMVLAHSWVIKVDADLDVLSADEIDAHSRSVAPLANEDLVVGGSAAGHGVVMRFDGCAL